MSPPSSHLPRFCNLTLWGNPRDISEFEDVISFKQQLEAKLFDSQDEMAIALDLKKSKLSIMLSAAKIVEDKEINAILNFRACEHDLILN